MLCHKYVGIVQLLLQFLTGPYVGVGLASPAIAGPVWELIKHTKAVYCCDFTNNLI